MTPTQKVALWERVNAYANVCGALEYGIAFKLGQDRNQETIFDLLSVTTVSTGGTGT